MSFFHSRASLHRRRNRVRGLEAEDGQWVQDGDEIERMITKFFKELFSSQSLPGQAFSFEGWSMILPVEQRTELDKSFSATEVVKALHQLGSSNKAPTPDGLNAQFFKIHWPVMGQEVTDFVLNFLNGERDLTEINSTCISLCPKVRSPRKVSQFRPISLCNVIYKLITKVLTNRLKLVLPSVISLTQGAFIPDPSIIDNVIVVFESMHFLKNKRLGRFGDYPINLDWQRPMIELSRAS